MCQSPFLRLPGGISVKDAVLSEAARDGATPHPCGQCLPCRINRSRVWTARILLESMQHPQNMFLTLTYNDEHFPEYGHLKKEDLQKFLKRFRKRLDQKVRYYAAGEYGEETKRPHFHLAIFGAGIETEQAVKESWPKGFYQIGELNRTTAEYISGYIVKGLSKGHPSLEGRPPEFSTMSRNPGVACSWVKKLSTKQGLNAILSDGPLREFMIGQKKFPLGRYLTNKLYECTGANTDGKDCLYHSYQMEVISTHQGPNYKDQIISVDKDKRRLQAIRQTRKERRKRL